MQLLSMKILSPIVKHVYTEAEAAAALGISIARLHQILDRHVFNQGTPRPDGIEFSASDLLLLSYWAKRPTPRRSTDNVVVMKKRQ